MNYRKYSIAALLLFILLFISKASTAQQDSSFVMKPIGTEAFEVMRKFFEYDKDVPLEARIVENLDESDYRREKIVFGSIDDTRVPGYLAIPKSGTAPYPCVLLLHGINGSKNNWWDNDGSPKALIKNLLTSGFAVLALDAEYHGERLINNDFESPVIFTFQKGWSERANRMVVQSVIDYRRAIDYLATRDEIDTSRFGIIGYSMGGFMTFSLTAIDPRIKVSVACVTPNIEEQYSPKAAYHFAPYITDQPFLMLMGNTDSFYTVAQAKQLHNFISSGSKELFLYDSGHKLPDEWTDRATEWMDKYLK